MAFHPVRFPLDIALQSSGGPTRQTDIVTLASGHEERNQRWQHSRRRYDAAYGIKSKSDMLAALAFFEERRGRFHSFLWRDGLDFSTAAAGQAVSDLDQEIATADGSQAQFQLIKTYGSTYDPYDRPISKPVSASLVLALDGITENSANYALNETTGIVDFLSPPAAGVNITAGFEFDVHVRFDTDEMQVDLSGFDSANIAAIPIVEVL